MSYSIKISAGFSSAHRLRYYRGKCEELHGHNWNVEVVVAKDELNKAGMVLDFKLVKSHLRRILEKLDHKYLNDLAYFKKKNPTSECITEYIYENLKTKLKSLKSVTVWENNTSCATYEE